ncbi:hypothetical protein [Mesorhizobium sp. M0998]|uniref:hypothetical protein n=1 Tax=Mesorhizobium sp. M0998 TaxID=2957044 RepID=UPI003338F6CF
MTRVRQPIGKRGSLKWIQHAVNRHPKILDSQITSLLGDTGQITWLSPRSDDDYAEYRDDAFLDLIGHRELQDRLAEFWPRRGPQWDALGKTSSGSILLVEAKAHIGEICSPGSSASALTRLIIERSLEATADGMGAKPKAPWIEIFYQLANRYAHLNFLRTNGVNAWLILVNFIDDTEMNGPSSAAEWRAVYQIVDHVMGVPKRNPMGKFVLHIHPSVAEIIP